MRESEIKDLLKKRLNFSNNDLINLEIFTKLLLEHNSKYNLISKSTESSIWSRHILDSAQLVDFIDFNSKNILADFGSGAGFPGIVLAIFNKNSMFHVNLYEKSPVKRDFLNLIKNELNIKLDLHENVYSDEIKADIVVCRAFKKINEIIDISREILKKPHKIIILKGKNAEEEINKVSLAPNYSYKLISSISDSDSKIIEIKVS